jgi:riboflavin synthase
MFTGLIEEIGRISAISQNGQGRTFEVQAEKVLDGLRIGDSMAVDGVCLTVVQFGAHHFQADAVEETLSRTTLANSKIDQWVNLERPLVAGSRLGGHFVQGHVDGVGQIAAIESFSSGCRLTLKLDHHLMQFVVEKGSIAVDGLSLTVAAVQGDQLEIAIIPHTWEVTAVNRKKAGDPVNIEVDILAKYISKFIQPFKPKEGLTFEKLTQFGYIGKND